ncbi:hypothetical protein Tco_0709195 [Tanacetum coccineum]
MHFCKASPFGLVSMYRKNRDRHCAYRPVASIGGRSLEPAAIMLLDGENLNKMKEKGDASNFMGYSTQSRDHNSSDPAPYCQTMALEHNNLSPDPQSQENVPIADETVTTSL